MAGGGGRRGGQAHAEADLLITVQTSEAALEAALLFVQYYRENAKYPERTYDFVERVGIEKIRKETVHGKKEEKKAFLSRLPGSPQRFP